MSNSTAQDAFEAMVRNGIWLFLRGIGFKRTKATFHRPVASNWQVINLQKSVYSDRGHVRFTVNLGVALDRLREGAHDWAEGKRPPETRCHLRERLGFLLREGEDIWWEVQPDTDTTALADAVTTALTHYGLPWLDARSTDDAIIALLSDPRRREAEYDHHLYWFEKLLAQLNRDELRIAVEQERQRKSAYLERRRQQARPE